MVLDKEDRSRVLVIGGTGDIGKHIVAASVRRDHPTSVLIRDAAPADLAKAQLLKSFIDSGVALIKGDLFDHESLVNAIKGADVVISAVGSRQLDEQKRIVMAIKEAGNVIKAEGIPHTYVCCNGFAETYLPSIGDVTAIGAGSPSDKITVLGDGDAKAVFVVEEDIAAYTMRAIDDTRTLNKILYMRPPANIVSHNELIALWEKKAGRTFQIARIPEADLLKLIKEAAYPLNMLLSLSLSVFVRGDQANFDIEPSFGVEATELYPDVKYTTVDEYLDRLLRQFLAGWNVNPDKQS